MTKIYLDEIDSIGKILVNIAKVDISEKIEELKTLPNQFDWSGLSHDTYIQEYNKKINKIIGYNENLKKIAEYFFLVRDDYSNVNDKINEAYEEILNEIKKEK